MTFYSPDHPAPLTPGEVWSSGLTSLDEAKPARLHRHLRHHGQPAAGVRSLDEEDNAPDAEQLVMTTQRFFQGHPGPSVAWKIFIQPPAK